MRRPLQPIAPRLRHLLALVPLAIGAAPSALRAQAAAAPSLTPDTRVRVWAPPRAVRWDGRLVSIDTARSRSLVLRRPAGTATGSAQAAARTDTIPLAAVERLEIYSAGRRSIGRVAGNALLGTVIGIALGAGGGYLAEGGSGCQGDMCGFGPVVFGLGGGAVGLVVGGIVGARRVGHWQAVRVPAGG